MENERRYRTRITSPWIWIILAAILLALLGLGGARLYIVRSRLYKQAIQEDLTVIANLKSEEIRSWRENELETTRYLATDDHLAELAYSYIQDSSPAAQRALLDLFSDLKDIYHYQEVYLADTTGTPLLSLSGSIEELLPDTLDSIRSALEEDRALLTNIHSDPSHEHIHLGAISPLTFQGRPVGVLVAIIDLEHFLYPLISSWPTASQTAETLLVRKEADSVLFLNPLKHTDADPLNLSIPLNQEDLPAVMAATGQVDVYRIGYDYRGVKVASYPKAIGDSPWFMITKIDYDEAFRSWEMEAMSLILVYSLLAILIILTTATLILSGKKSYYKRIMEAERELAEAEHRFRQYIENAPDGIFVADEKGYYVEVNPAAAAMTGFSQEELLGMHLMTQYPEEEHSKARQVFSELLERGKSHIEGQYLTRVGARRWWTIDAVRISDTRFLGFARDTTDQVLSREHEKDLEAKLRQAQRLEAVGRLAGGVAHDFNNMLQAILGYTSMAIEEVPEQTPELMGYLGEIHKAATRSAELTRQLLGFARQQTIAPVKIELNERIEGLLNMLTRLIGEDIDLRLEPSAQRVTILMDPSQIDQILTNLVINAKEAIDGHGQITIHVGSIDIGPETLSSPLEGIETGRYALLEVSDSGHGMDQETRDHIFEPFFSTKAAHMGAGLGLANIYGIVKQNRGTIHVYSEVGIGTTFKIYLPQTAEDSMDVESMTATPTEDLRGEGAVLLVEDEPVLLQLTARILTSSGYTVHAAKDPIEAIELYQELFRTIRVMVTDVVMPEMNGSELYTRLVEIDEDLRVLYVSGYTANVIVKNRILSQGTHFLQKPFSSTDLLREVKRLFE